MLFPGVEVTQSLSNVIKASAIRYTEEKKSIDYNERSEEFVRLFVQKHAMVSNDGADKEKNISSENGDSSDGFETGIDGLFVDRENELEKEADFSSEQAEIVSNEEREVEFRMRTEQILDDAREQVKQILAEAEAQAEQIRNRAYEEAKNQGYSDGRELAQAECEQLKQKLSEQIEKNRTEYEKQVEELEPAFVEMVIKIVKKLTGVVLEDKRAIVMHLLEQAFSKIDAAPGYLIRVSPEDFELVDSKKTDLVWKLKEGTTLEVIEDRMLRKGQCIIETESRIIDCSIDTQLKNLSADLRMLAGVKEAKEGFL